MKQATRLMILVAVLATAALAGAPQVAEASSYRVGPLLPISGPSPYQDGCNLAGSHATSAEGEPSLTVDPANPANIVAAWIQDLDSPFASAGGVAVSHDAGRSWKRAGVADGSACAGGEARYKYLADPWVAFGPRHTVWAATLPFTDANPGAVVVNRSSDAGDSFGPAGFVDRDVDPSDFDDDETVAADPRDPDRAYVSWVKQQKNPAGVVLGATSYLSSTSDGGRTWSAPRALATVPAGRAIAGGVVVVRPNGQVLVTYPVIDPDQPVACISDEGCAGVVTVYARRSTDRARTWSKPVVAARYRRAPMRDPAGDKLQAPAERYSLTLDRRGVAYLAAHDETNSPRSRIVVRRSRDGGRTWRSLTNADEGSRAHGFKAQPTIAASRDALGVIYYDFRDDRRRGDGKTMFSWWFAYSRDGGRSWHEQRLSRPSDLHSAPATYSGHVIGDYFGLQTAGRNFLAAVTVARPLTRTGPTDIAFVRIDARGRPRASASAAASSCSPSGSILKSPRAGSHEVQAKALNDRGDVAGFADGRDGTFHALLWKGGKATGAVDLGVPRGYVSSEAYGVNNHRVVFGLLYDRKDRAFPFRWKRGRLTMLRGPNGRMRQADVPDRNTINERGEIAATLIIGGQRRAARWTHGDKATLLPALPGHAWTNAWSISDHGAVSGWSRKLPDDDGENNPVLWMRSGQVIPLQTAPGQADGAAEATNRFGLTVGYLGNLGTDSDPEHDVAVVWQTQAAEPLLLARASPGDTYAELVDVNDRGQAAGMSGRFTENGFAVAKTAIWQPGWTGLRTLSVPHATRHHRVVIAGLHDINAHGAIVGDVFGLAGKAYNKVQRIYPVLWTCPFSG